MKQFLIKFRAEYYCQGYEWSWFERLVTANSYEEACNIISDMHTEDWEHQTPEMFKDLTI